MHAKTPDEIEYLSEKYNRDLEGERHQRDTLKSFQAQINHLELPRWKQFVETELQASRRRINLLSAKRSKVRKRLAAAAPSNSSTASNAPRIEEQA